MHGSEDAVDAEENAEEEILNAFDPVKSLMAVGFASYLQQAADFSRAGKAYEDYKRNFLNTERLCEADGIQFIPVIAEAHGGGWG